MMGAGAEAVVRPSARGVQAMAVSCVLSTRAWRLCPIDGRGRAVHVSDGNGADTHSRAINGQIHTSESLCLAAPSTRETMCWMAGLWWYESVGGLFRGFSLLVRYGLAINGIFSTPVNEGGELASLRTLSSRKHATL